jgi:micrococcal nuclease
MPKSPEHLKAMLGLLLAAWLCWRVIRGLARMLVICAFGLLLTGVAACGVPGDAGSTGGAFDSGRSGTLTRVVDGDTVHVAIGGDDVTLRILGISAPETKKRRDCGGPQATALMKRLAPPGTKVTVTTDSTTGDTVDAYGRYLGFADVRGRDVGEQIIRAGRATVYSFRGRRFSRIERYEAAERDARAARRGSWATCPGFDSRR